MLLRLKIGGVHSVVLPVPGGGYDSHGASCYAAAPCCWRRMRRPAAAGSVVARQPRGSATVMMALKEEPEGSRSGFAGGGPSWDPGLEIQVPFEQRPVGNTICAAGVDRLTTTIPYIYFCLVWVCVGERVLCSQG